MSFAIKQLNPLFQSLCNRALIYRVTMQPRSIFTILISKNRVRHRFSVTRPTRPKSLTPWPGSNTDAGVSGQAFRAGVSTPLSRRVTVSSAAGIDAGV